MLSKTHRLIEQQIARYFSQLSTVTKIGLLMRSPSVNMNEEEEADANDLASEVETDRLFFHMYCLCSRKRLTTSWDFIKGNLQEAYWSNTAGSFLVNFTSHAIKRRQHSI